MPIPQDEGWAHSDLMDPRNFERWDGSRWPPRDPITRLLADLVDRSPRVDWLTSGQAVREAERLREELANRGYSITKETT